MPDGIVAARALQAFSLAVHDVAVDGRGDVLVATAAGVLRYLMVELGDLNGVGIVAAREVERMPESIVGLHRIFADQIVRGVAIVAGRDRVMA